jgi:hypothetical protein
MSQRNDSIVTDYAVNVPLTNGVAWNGALLSLHAAISLSFQLMLTNGAAGTFYINPTNVDNLPAWFQNGFPNVQYQSNGQMTANATASAVLASGAPALAFRKAWLSFVPTASGNLYVAACVRRYPS